MRFDLVDLRLFMNICDTGTITGGADASFMTLASASERVRGMEDALGVPLFVRQHRGVSPTPAGQTLLHHARHVLRQIEHMHGELGEYGNGLKGHIRMLCNTSGLQEPLPALLGSYLARHPRLSIDLEERGSADTADAVRHGLCDIGLCSDAVPLDGLQVFDFRPDTLVLIAPQDHPIAARKTCSLAEASAYPFVGMADSALQNLVTANARRAGVAISYRVRLRNLESVCAMVGQGIGLGIVPHAAAMKHRRSAQIRKISLQDAWAQRNLVLCVRNLDELPSHAQQFVRHLCEGARSGAS